MSRFSIRRQVGFNHCDPAGRVSCPRCHEMASALVERFFAGGLGHDCCGMGDAGLRPPMGRIGTRFTAPSRLGDRLTLAPAVTRLGRAPVRFDPMCETAERPRFAGSATAIRAFTPRLPTPGGVSLPGSAAAGTDLQKAAFR